MARPLRHAFGCALIAAILVGCGGSGSQPTTLDRTLNLSAVTAYPDSATASTSLEVLSGGGVVKPIAEFTGKSDGQKLVVWGTRDATTRLVSGIHEGALTADGFTTPVYVRYNASGGVSSLYDSDTKSYLTLSDLESSGNSILAVGYDGTTGKSATVRATYQNGGVTVKQLDRAAGASRFVSNAEIAAVLSKGRVTGASDPIEGFTSVYQNTASESVRTKILTAVFRAAAVVLKDDAKFSKIVAETAGFLLLNQLEDSYAEFFAAGTPTLATDETTSQPYRTDLP